ncbi:alpha/beta hydrolase [Kouleothrix sp.]|uniref:alpha/beta hydrolase n=1 Tax=Kouleothrix sp. TaxID=2779161 RepID=UPI00391889E8
MSPEQQLPPPVSILYSEQHTFHSNVLDQDYVIKVRLPERYSQTAINYPVLYLLDGDHAFAMATDIVQYLEYYHHIPDIIIVSPAYGSKLGPAEGGNNLRDRDFAPFPTPWSDLPPRGEAYLRFLTEELLPFAEQRYRINSTNRVLWGYSSSALFALYTVFHATSVFQRFIVLDGFLDQLLDFEARYATQHGDLPVELFVVSAYYDLTPLVTALEQRAYPHLHLTHIDATDTPHFALPGIWLTKGLMWVFQSP